MQDIATEIVSIADACLGGLSGRTALLIGPEERRKPYVQLLRKAHMHFVYEEETPEHLPSLLPNTQLVMSLLTAEQNIGGPLISAVSIARGSVGRHALLLILDLSNPASVEEMAGLLPTVCLYTPQDLSAMLAKKKKAS